MQATEALEHSVLVQFMQLSRIAAVQTITNIDLHFGVQFTEGLKHAVLVQSNADEQDRSSANNYKHWSAIH